MGWFWYFENGSVSAENRYISFVDKQKRLFGY